MSCDNGGIIENNVEIIRPQFHGAVSNFEICTCCSILTPRMQRLEQTKRVKDLLTKQVEETGGKMWREGNVDELRQWLLGVLEGER